MKNLKLGPVNINVKNLEVMKEFYNKTLGLDIIKEDIETVNLGKNNDVLLALHHTKHLDKAALTHAGLYHFAILFSSQKELARTTQKVISTSPQFFTGSTDHLVSEAFYFSDPEGNGIELYYDRDRSTWQWENNQIKMATEYLNPLEYIARYIVIEETDTKATIGHIHLKVGDIEKAKTFYVNILGFDVTAEFPGTLFVSVGRYHHHLGINTWESYGATERNDSLGLRHFTFILSERKTLSDLKERLKENTIAFQEDHDSIIFADPWNNTIKVEVHSL